MPLRSAPHICLERELSGLEGPGSRGHYEASDPAGVDPVTHQDNAIGLSPEPNYRELIISADSSSKETLAKLDLLWKCQSVFFSKVETENIAFLEQQK